MHAACTCVRPVAPAAAIGCLRPRAYNVYHEQFPSPSCLMCLRGASAHYGLRSPQHDRRISWKHTNSNKKKFLRAPRETSPALRYAPPKQLCPHLETRNGNIISPRTCTEFSHSLTTRVGCNCVGVLPAAAPWVMCVALQRAVNSLSAYCLGRHLTEPRLDRRWGSPLDPSCLERGAFLCRNPTPVSQIDETENRQLPSRRGRSGAT